MRVGSGLQTLFQKTALAVLGCLAFDAGAQLSISIRTDREKYLRYETVQVEVTLCNFTGNSLMFSHEEQTGYLRLYVESKEGGRLTAYDPKANLAEDLILGTGATKRLNLTLNNLYNIQKEGSYVVYAVIGHPRLQQDYRSASVLLEIIGGLTIWTRDIGLPDADPGSTIKTRQVSLLAFSEKKNDLYAIQVEDAELVYGIVRLGYKISGSTPQCEVDALSHIHVLFMGKPRLYDYRIYDYNLQLKLSKYYLIDRSIPMLQRDQELGRIMVAGGREAVEGVDYQKEVTADTANPLPEKIPGKTRTAPGMKPLGDVELKASRNPLGPKSPAVPETP